MDHSFEFFKFPTLRFWDFDGSKKNFAISNNKNKLFSIAIGIINGRNKIDMIKSKILSDTKNLVAARKWLSKLD